MANKVIKGRRTVIKLKNKDGSPIKVNGKIRGRRKVIKGKKRKGGSKHK